MLRRCRRIRQPGTTSSFGLVSWLQGKSCGGGRRARVQNTEGLFSSAVARLLGALCRCICDPQLNAASQEMRPAESLGQLLLFHLNSKSALQRVTVALVLCEWAALQKVGRAR